MHFVSQITLPPSEASRVTVARVFQQPARATGWTTVNGRTFVFAGRARRGIQAPTFTDEPGFVAGFLLFDEKRSVRMSEKSL
jgi:hypothetical protein